MIDWIPCALPYVLNVTNPFSLITSVPIAGLTRGERSSKLKRKNDPEEDAKG
jgi:hypothetical protein